MSIYRSEASFLNRMIGFKEKSSTFACNYCFTLWTAEDVKVILIFNSFFFLLSSYSTTSG